MNVTATLAVVYSTISVVLLEYNQVYVWNRVCSIYGTDIILRC